MPNDIKRTSSGGLALQITCEARTAGLVEEADHGAVRLADAYLFAFDGLLLVTDADRVAQANVAELVSTAARDAESAYPGGKIRVTTRGDGYQIPLPGAEEAGFHASHAAPCKTARGILLIHHDGGGRLARDLKTIRQEQMA